MKTVDRAVSEKSRSGLAKIAVIRLPRISNFTDIAPLEAVDELDVSYVSNISQFGDPDVVIIPGSKIRSAIFCG